MLLPGTFVVLALWLGFVWFVDPDGFRRRSSIAKTKSRSQSETPRLKKL